MLKSLLLNSELLKITIPALVFFKCSYASKAINNFRNSLTVRGIRLHILRITLTLAVSTYILRNSLTVAESRKTSYVRLLQNPRHKKCIDKISARGLFVRGSTEVLLVESIYILEYGFSFFARIQEHTDTKMCAYSVHRLAS